MHFRSIFSVCLVCLNTQIYSFFMHCWNAKEFYTFLLSSLILTLVYHLLWSKVLLTISFYCWAWFSLEHVFLQYYCYDLNIGSTFMQAIAFSTDCIPVYCPDITHIILHWIPVISKHYFILLPFYWNLSDTKYWWMVWYVNSSNSRDNLSVKGVCKNVVYYN